ncbi:MAG: cytochrome ubiquinol oxidase subunit I [Candidatus Midichloria sp.]|nr:MAG: cytochrome ubiquinol oxidase subunit I [Candidatus Midichloria sp.]
MDALTLARIQFAVNISFHILFPSLSIGLGWFLLFFKIKYTKTGDEEWFNAYKLWVKIFALCFALGVVSGITMSFQFGTNWPGFMEKVGNIAGPLLAYEILTAFFLEATFLGIMLYGFKRVSNRVHTLSIFLVAVGTTLSAFWIITLNSWMQTPSGFVIISNKIYAVSWFEIIFNPSMPYKFLHMMLASFLTVAFLIAGISAYCNLRDRSTSSFHFYTLKTSIYTAAILIPIQILIGDLHGLSSFEHQPAKMAAIEAIWEDEKGADFRVFAIPNEEKRKNDFEITIPHLSSILLTHKLDSKVKGIKSFAYYPPVALVFFAFRTMICIGLLMLLVSWTSSFCLLKNKHLSTLKLKALTYMTFSGWIALLAGWYTTEIGRQPWVVYNILLTKEAAAQTVTEGMIASSLTLYIVTYVSLVIFFILLVFYLARKSIYVGIELPKKDGG